MSTKRRSFDTEQDWRAEKAASEPHRANEPVLPPYAPGRVNCPCVNCRKGVRPEWLGVLYAAGVL